MLRIKKTVYPGKHLTFNEVFLNAYEQNNIIKGIKKKSNGKEKDTNKPSIS